MSNTNLSLVGNRIAGVMLLCTGVALSLCSATASAESMPHQMNHGAMQAMSPDAGKAMPMSDAVVKKINTSRGRVTLQHGDIPNVMPAMTMAYRIKDVKQLEGLHAGDKVRFALVKEGDDFVVTHLEVVR